MQQKLTADCAAVVSTVAVELIEKNEEEKEDKEEEDVEEGSYTEDLVLKQVPVPWAAIPVAAGFWASGPSDEVDGRGQAASLRSQGKALTVQAGPGSLSKADEEPACQL